MTNHKSFTKEVSESKKQYAVWLKPSTMKKLQAIAVAESEVHQKMIFRTELIQRALEQYIKRYQRKNGDDFLMYL